MTLAHYQSFPAVESNPTLAFAPASVGARGLRCICPPTEKGAEALLEIAARSQVHWREVAVEHRIQILLALAQRMEDSAADYAALDHAETGRSLEDLIQGSLPKAVETLRWFCNAARNRCRTQHFAAHSEIREPLGVCLAVLPWNDPMVVTIWKLAPALLEGNAIILKPSEYSTGSALKLAHDFADLSGCEGVVSVAAGKGSDLPPVLVSSPVVAGVFFTGSAATGRHLHAVANQQIQKPVYCETGGKGAALIYDLDSAQLPDVAKHLAASLCMNQGQICSAPSRIVIQDSLAGEFFSLYTAALNEFNPGTHRLVGGLISAQAAGRVAAMVNDFFHDQTPAPIADCFDTRSIRPFAVEVHDESAPLWQEELFAPVACLRRVSTLNEGLRAINHPRFALANGVFSQNTQLIERVIATSYSGMVHVNSWGVDAVGVPFGGFGDSGLGKEKSMATFDQFSRLKVVSQVPLKP